MNDPYLSIIMPARNEGATIKLVLDSVNEAIRKASCACEVILVDNGSTDMTRSIAESCGCRVVTDSSNTIAKLRNVGSILAKGEMLAFLDADCVVDPLWITYCTRNFSDGRIAIVGTRAVPDPRNPTWVECAWFNLFTGIERLDFPDWLGTSNLFIPRRIFQEFHGFDEELETAEDVDFCRRIGTRYLIFLEKRINTIHLRESKSIPDLFKRELRRGKFSLRQFMKSNDKGKDFPSVFIPFVVLMLLLLLLVSPAVRLDVTLAFGVVAALLLLPIVLMIRKRAIITGVADVAGTYAVSITYITARALSLCHETFSIVMHKVRTEKQQRR